MTGKIMLLYNGFPSLPENVPAGWTVTTDRRCFQQADAVVFRLPNLYRELERELEQSPGQLWVAWHTEPEKHYPWFRAPEIRETFDLWMSYRQDADVVYPHYRYEYAEHIAAGRKHIPVSGKINQSACYLKEWMKTDKTAECRIYLKELMKHTEVESFGKLYVHKQPSDDCSLEAKLNMYRAYKFVIAFEDTAETDYVTEKFFDPLAAGSVPVYWGAPNIDCFAPGDNCFVDVCQFESPRSLAAFIHACYADEQLYAGFFDWKNRPLRPSFLHKMDIQTAHPLVRLCRKVDEKRLSQQDKPSHEYGKE